MNKVSHYFVECIKTLTAAFTWSSREPMTAGDCMETMSPIQVENTHQSAPSTVRAFLSGLLPKCAKAIYHRPLYLLPAVEEGSTVLVVELNIANFSYSFPKLSLIGSYLSVGIVHVQVMLASLARNPSSL